MILHANLVQQHNMDFLDPRKQRADTVRLLIGYVLIGIAILIATLILLYQAYGFGITKSGQVIQNGLVFVSSQPTGARIYLNSKLYKSNTDTRLQVQAAQYNIEVQRDGYRNWQRLISVVGGSVEHYDYPLLIPTTLTTTSVKAYPSAPGLATQSPDRRWLIVQQPEALVFDLYDLADPTKVTTAATILTVPDSIATAPKTTAPATQSWKVVEWSTDNRHVLMQHIYGNSSEYISLDRQDISQSVNLTKILNLNANQQLSLHDKKYDKYYVYDNVSHSLGTTSIADAGQVTPLLEQVLTYKSYGSNIVLYMTDKSAPSGKVLSVLRDGTNTYKIREHAAGGPFLVNLAQYNGDWFMAVGASADNKVYVYKDLQQIRQASLTAALVPVQVLKVMAPNYLEFSSNTQFIMAENGTSFAQYDAENDKGYTYTAKNAIDAPTSHATWIDGYHMTYVSSNNVTILDYDNINGQTIVPASPNYVPFFNRDYSYVYTLASSPTAGQAAVGLVLNSSSLRTAADR